MSEKDFLLRSFCKQGYDSHVYGFKVINAGEYTYRNWRSESSKYKDCYLYVLEITLFGCICGVLDFLSCHYANADNTL